MNSESGEPRGIVLKVLFHDLLATPGELIQIQHVDRSSSFFRVALSALPHPGRAKHQYEQDDCAANDRYRNCQIALLLSIRSLSPLLLFYGMSSLRVSRILGMSYGFARWPFIPTDKAMLASSSNAFAVTATMGMFAFSGSSSDRICLVAS